MIGIESAKMPLAAQKKIALSQDHDPSTIRSMPEVRQALLEEQKYRCAYCERPLTDEFDATKIEHFHPQSLKKFESLSCKTQSGADNGVKAVVTWTNLLIVCPGHSDGGKAATCDSRKGDTDVCDRIRNPKLMPPLTSQVRVDFKDGTVHAVNGDQGSNNVINTVLGLNDGFLCRGRLNTYRAATRRLNDLNKAARNRSSLKQAKARPHDIKTMLEKAASEQPYGSVYITLLEKRGWL